MISELQARSITLRAEFCLRMDIVLDSCIHHGRYFPLHVGTAALLLLAPIEISVYPICTNVTGEPRISISLAYNPSFPSYAIRPITSP